MLLKVWDEKMQGGKKDLNWKKSAKRKETDIISRKNEKAQGLSYITFFKIIERVYNNIVFEKVKAFCRF